MAVSLKTWIKNHQAPVLFYSAMNTFGNNISITPTARILIVILAVFAIVFDRTWKKLLGDHPMVAESLPREGK